MTGHITLFCSEYLCLSVSACFKFYFADTLCPPSGHYVYAILQLKQLRKRSRRSTPSSSTAMNATAVETPALSFPSQVMDQLVARVAEEVTRRLSPAAPISSSAAVDSSLGGSNTVTSIACSNLPELPLTSRSDPASSPARVSTCGSSQLPGLPLVSTTDVMTTQTSTMRGDFHQY